MTRCLYRVALANGTSQLARGDTDAGPLELLSPDLSIAGLLGSDGGALGDAIGGAPSVASARGLRVLAPVDDQEVWAAGVTYLRSRDARIEESAEPTVYDRVYEAARPELFFKSAGWRVRGTGEPIGVRADSAWNVPEPELALIVAADGTIAGYTIGNDVSSRTIEGDNPLYLPQAKVYDGACSLGPALVAAVDVEPPFRIGLTIQRAGVLVFDGVTSTDQLRRSVEELVDHLVRALSFPTGAVLLTGTGIVPDPPFSLAPDDTVTIAIDGLGQLENPVVRVGGSA